MDKSGKKKFGADSIVVGFALFSMFFGAGNVIFPPYLGFGAGTQWVNGFLFYFIADIGLALFALFTLLKVGGSENITGRIGSVASNILMSAIILCIGPMVAIPRTAATTFEMSVAPLISGVSPVIFSVAFFIVVLLLSIRQSAVIDVVGKVLTPALLIGLLVLIIKGIISPLGSIVNPHVDSSFVIVNGIKSGYQTMDVLVALAFGIIILKSAQEKGYSDARESSKMIRAAAVIAGVLLLIVYFGLTYLGATSASLFSLGISRAELVIGIVQRLLGKVGLVIFAVVVVIALIIQLFALAQAKLDLYPAVLEIKRQRDQRHALLHNTGIELCYLALMHEKPAGSHGVLIENVSLLIRAYMQRPHKKLAVFNGAVAVLHIHRARAQGFDLRSGKLNARLVALKDKVIVEGLAVCRDLLCTRLLRHISSPAFQYILIITHFYARKKYIL